MLCMRALSHVNSRVTSSRALLTTCRRQSSVHEVAWLQIEEGFRFCFTSTLCTLFTVMQGLNKDVLLLVAAQISVGDALALSQCFSLAHRVITDDWLSQTFFLPCNVLERMRNTTFPWCSYRQFCVGVFLSGSVWHGQWNSVRDRRPFGHSGATVWVERVQTNSRLICMKVARDRMDDESFVAEGHGIVVVVSIPGRRCQVRLTAKIDAIEKNVNDLGVLSKVECRGNISMELDLTCEPSKGELQACAWFGGSSENVRREV
jgi:hypothetical protein